MTSSFDAVVVGAGPGGSIAATCMARAGLRVLLVEKETFPRDKICGDALSGKSVDVLRRVGLLDAVQAAPQVGSWGIIFGGPYGDKVSIPFTKEFGKPVPPGFVCMRETFDEIVFDAAREAGAEVWQGTTVTGIVREEGRVVGVELKRDGAAETVRAPIVVGADGAYSAVARGLGIEQLDEAHYCAGLRVYYEGVRDLHPQGFIEIYYVEETLPGYFWVFPLADGRANVGVGMLSKEIKRRGVKLKEALGACIESEQFRARFEGARALGPVRGWGLPLGSKPRPMAGDGWLLVGDAASLIDPFTGEGIGNAMVSGEFAAKWAIQAHEKNDFSAGFLAGYKRDTLDYLGSELKLSHTLQKLGRWKWLLNTVIRKASRSPELAEAISSMFDDESERQRLASPLFYLRVLTA